MADPLTRRVAAVLALAGIAVSVFCWTKAGGDGSNWGVGSWAIVATVTTLGLMFMAIRGRMRRSALLPMMGLVMVLAVALWVATTV